MSREVGRLAAHSVGLRLKAARDHRGYTMLELAERCGLSHSTVNVIEKGQKTPRTDTVERLARALDVPRAWLAYGDGERPEWV